MADDQALQPRRNPAGEDADAGEATLEPDFARASSVLRAERTAVRRLSNVLRFNDFMTFMMVIATIFSAFATWRTAQVTNLLFAIAERPYIGVDRVTVDSIDAAFARVMVDCRNFGNVSANDGVAQVSVTIDDRRLPESSPTIGIHNIGIVSPTVPHRIFRFVPKNLYEQVRAGRSRMIVQIVFNYRGPDQRQFCYNEFMTYDVRTADFISTGGSDRCDGQIY